MRRFGDGAGRRRGAWRTPPAVAMGEPIPALPVTPSVRPDRALLVELYRAAVAGAAPGPLTTAAMHATLARWGSRREPVRLIAIGKAAPAMAIAAADAARASGHTLAGGLVVAAGTPAASTAIAPLATLAGDHPLPGARSFHAAQALALESVRAHAGERAIVLLSGGATSLVAAPVPPLTPNDLVDLFDLLHRSGLDIHAMNVVRKRVTRWGAGRLAVALARQGVPVDALLVSDVPGDDPADIGSGPCAPDPSTAAEVRALLRDAALLSRVPASVAALLDDVERGAASETPKPGDPAFDAVTTRVIGDNTHAISAAVTRARMLGHRATADSSPLRGEAASCGVKVAEALLSRAEAGWTGCVVWGGETTVRRGGGGGEGGGGARAGPTDSAGLGGRCQELALAASGRLARGGPAATRVTLLAAGTDGRDGPTDAAGAFADAGVWDAILRAGLDPARALARHDAHPALDAAGALLRVGPTGTNVMDVVIGVVR